VSFLFLLPIKIAYHIQLFTIFVITIKIMTITIMGKLKEASHEIL